MRPASTRAQYDGVGRAIDTSLIQYRCASPNHRTSADVSDRVFIHCGGWAYCEAGKLAGNHRMLETGGLPRQVIERGLGTTANRRKTG
jgi:hypothetical protein